MDWKTIKEVSAALDQKECPTAALATMAAATKEDWTNLSVNLNNWDKLQTVVRALAAACRLRHRHGLPALARAILEAAAASQDLLAALDAQLQACVNSSGGHYPDSVATTAKLMAEVLSRDLPWRSTNRGLKLCLSIESCLREIGIKLCDDNNDDDVGEIKKENSYQSCLEYLHTLLANKPLNLNRNDSDRQFASAKQYLEDQLALHSEDFVRDLRTDLGKLKSSGSGAPDLQALRSYGQVNLTDLEVGRDGIRVRLSLTKEVIDYELVDWDSSKRLLDGSLVILLCPSVKKSCLAIVKEENRRDLKRGVLRVAVHDLKEAEFLFKEKVLMFESSAYLEAFWPFVSGLKGKTLPLEKYFLDAKTLEPPKTPCKQFKVPRTFVKDLFSCSPASNMKTAEEIFYSLNQPEVDSSKNTLDLLDALSSANFLDSAQFEAVRDSFQSEIGLVQGPPGTGKSFVGKILLCALLDNRQHRSGGPIMVVSQTNKCLDSLLESLLPRKTRIVRLGTRCTSEKLEGHRLSAIRQFAKDSMMRDGVIHKAEKVVAARRAKAETELTREVHSLDWKKIDSEALRYIDGLNEKLKREVGILDDIRILESSILLGKGGLEVLGATATGAAKHRSLVEAVGPRVAVVEEAALLTEPQLVAALPSSCRHIILIGDHQQLRPSTVSYFIAKKFNLEVSFFERLAAAGQPVSLLREQHRMGPHISRVVSKLFYPDLKDHPSVKVRQKVVQGMVEGIYLLKHDYPEDAGSMVLSKSRSNEFEVHFLLHLAAHLVDQGHEPDAVTILTTYVGQQLLFQQELARFPSLKNMAVYTVDNYQGEENDIILLSLVRSGGDTIGFLSEANRLCVALSRARRALYAVGNLDGLAEKSELWREAGRVIPAGRQIAINCFAHPDNVRQVSSPSDLELEVLSGCSLGCRSILPGCNHRCPLPCHPRDKQHFLQKHRCQERCDKSCPAGGHPCRKLCSEPCGSCDVMLKDWLVACGHKVDLECGKRDLTTSCGRTCGDSLTCGHACGLPCHGEKSPHRSECLEECNRPKSGCQNQQHPTCNNLCWQPCEPCSEKVLKHLPCGHEAEGPCGEDVTSVECRKRCKKPLKCGHVCRNYCYECLTGCDPCYRCS